MGHCFGVMEQFFTHLLPSGRVNSPFHFASTPSWKCDRSSSCCGKDASSSSEPHCPPCSYTFTAAKQSNHLPLLLSHADVTELLASGIQPEVGALCAAHLNTNPYSYGKCPMCGVGTLRSRPVQPTFSPLLMVELGRLDGGVSAGSSAAGDLSWRPTVSPSMTLTIGGEQMVYSAIAVVYNDGSHWWADLMCHRHFKRVDKQPKGLASYRYDGLEAEGMLRFTGYNLTLTSDSRHISLVLYRKGPPIGSASLESPPPSIAAPAAAASADAEQSTFRDARSAGARPPPAPIRRRRSRRRLPRPRSS